MTAIVQRLVDESRNEGQIEGEEIERREERRDLIISLIHQGIISLPEGAKQLGISEDSMNAML